MICNKKGEKFLFLLFVPTLVEDMTYHSSSSTKLLRLALLRNYDFISIMFFLKCFSYEQVLLALKPWLKTIDHLVCFGWKEEWCKYWCLSIGFIYKSVSSCLSESLMLRSRSKMFSLNDSCVNIILGWNLLSFLKTVCSLFSPWPK